MRIELYKFEPWICECFYSYPAATRQDQPQWAPPARCLAQKLPLSRTPSEVVKASSTSSKPTIPPSTSMDIQERSNHGAMRTWIPRRPRSGPVWHPNTLSSHLTDNGQGDGGIMLPFILDYPLEIGRWEVRWLELA